MGREREVEMECVLNDRNVFMSRDRERVCVCVCVCERVKRDIKGPLPVRVRLGLGYGLGYQAFCPVFHFLTFCPLAFCLGFNLVYTAEIRGQPLVLYNKMIVCAGWSEKTSGPICNILFGSYRFEHGLLNTRPYMSHLRGQN